MKKGTRRNLETYQRQLQGVVDSLTKGGGSLPPAVQGVSSSIVSSTSPPAGLFGGELQKSATPRVSAGLLGDRSLILPKGTAFTCALKTKLISAASGFVSCQVQRNVFSDDGRVLLVERGSHMDGEYRIASVRPGTVRIPVLWTRIRTPNGVTVDIESPGTGPLGESGIDGYLDNRWPERIGAAMLLSLIDDSVKLAIQDRANTGTAGTGNTILLPSTTQHEQARREGARQHDQHPAADLPKPGRHRRHLCGARRRFLVRLRTEGGRAMNGSSFTDGIDSDLADAWCGDATSVVEFLRPLRAQLDAPGVLEVCVNRPGEMMVETAKGWQSVRASELTVAADEAERAREHLIRTRTVVAVDQDDLVRLALHVHLCRVTHADHVLREIGLALNAALAAAAAARPLAVSAPGRGRFAARRPCRRPPGRTGHRARLPSPRAYRYQTAGQSPLSGPANCQRPPFRR